MAITPTIFLKSIGERRCLKLLRVQNVDLKKGQLDVKTEMSITQKKAFSEFSTLGFPKICFKLRHW